MSDTMHLSRWGDADRKAPLPAAAGELLQLAFGELSPVPAVAESEITVPATRLSDQQQQELGAFGQLDVSGHARLLHAGGKSTPDLLRMRAGALTDVPDAVARPASHDDVLQLLAWCAQHNVAVVPFGGGTSVVGGLNAPAGEHVSVVALDLGRLNQLVALDEISQTATLQAGVLGPRAEELLGEHGFTLGHFPQSFEYASIGGFAATRSSGQSSSGYGRFDSMVVGLKVATLQGTWTLGSAPANAAGPDLRQLVLGSEGSLGVITEVTVAIRKAPERKVYESWRAPSFEVGAGVLRELVQTGANPTILRLSDETETALNLAKPDEIGQESAGGSLILCGYEGTPARVDRMRAEAAEVLTAHGCAAVGEQDGEHWADGRFAAPYLRDSLLDEGVLVETVETATFWSNVPKLYAEVKAALESSLAAGGTNPIVMCHISHVYRTGASLYFTIACKQSQDPTAQWLAAKAAASDAMIAAGATITHHHAVGRDHQAWYAQEVGPIAVQALRAVKEELDPSNILNPGVLIP